MTSQSFSRARTIQFSPWAVSDNHIGCQSVWLGSWYWHWRLESQSRSCRKLYKFRLMTTRATLLGHHVRKSSSCVGWPPHPTNDWLSDQRKEKSRTAFLLWNEREEEIQRNYAAATYVGHSTPLVFVYLYDWPSYWQVLVRVQYKWWTMDFLQVQMQVALCGRRGGRRRYGEEIEWRLWIFLAVWNAKDWRVEIIIDSCPGCLLVLNHNTVGERSCDILY